MHFAVASLCEQVLNSLWKCHFQGYFFTNGTQFPPQVTDRPHCPVGPSMKRQSVQEVLETSLGCLSNCWKFSTVSRGLCCPLMPIKTNFHVSEKHSNSIAVLKASHFFYRKPHMIKFVKIPWFVGHRHRKQLQTDQSEVVVWWSVHTVSEASCPHKGWQFQIKEHAKLPPAQQSSLGKGLLWETPLRPHWQCSTQTRRRVGLQKCRTLLKQWHFYGHWHCSQVGLHFRCMFYVFLQLLITTKFKLNGK